MLRVRGEKWKISWGQKRGKTSLSLGLERREKDEHSSQFVGMGKLKELLSVVLTFTGEELCLFLQRAHDVWPLHLSPPICPPPLLLRTLSLAGWFSCVGLSPLLVCKFFTLKAPEQQNLSFSGFQNPICSWFSFHPSSLFFCLLHWHLLCYSVGPLRFYPCPQ